MKTRTTIFITVIVTVLILVGGFYAWKYELKRNQTAYNNGKMEGWLYTDNTGKIVYISERTESGITLSEKPIVEYYNMRVEEIQQEMDQ